MSKKAKEKSSSSPWKWGLTTLVLLALGNFLFHIYANPVHILSFFSQSMNKTPKQTWEAYSEVFRSSGDTKVTPELLAAIAQVESQGNPLAAPDWRFRFSTDFAEWFAPASTAFGLMQITKGTFDLMLKTCLSDCPPKITASRVKVGDSVKLSAHLIRKTISELLTGPQWERLGPKNATRLAAVIHLCGPEMGRRLVAVGHRVDRLPRCGAHWPDVYTEKVWQARQTFEGLSRSALLASED